MSLDYDLLARQRDNLARLQPIELSTPHGSILAIVNLLDYLIKEGDLANLNPATMGDESADIANSDTTENITAYCKCCGSTCVEAKFDCDFVAGPNVWVPYYMPYAKCTKCYGEDNGDSFIIYIEDSLERPKEVVEVDQPSILIDDGLLTQEYFEIPDGVGTKKVDVRLLAYTTTALEIKETIEVPSMMTVKEIEVILTDIQDELAGSYSEIEHGGDWQNGDVTATIQS